MAVSGSWRIYGSVSGLPTGTVAVDASIVAGSAAVGDQSTVAYTTGFHAITPPANATAALIIPPSANTNGITLKGVTGDTGIPLSLTQPTLITFVAGSTFGLTIATATTTITIQYM